MLQECSFELGLGFYRLSSYIELRLALCLRPSAILSPERRSDVKTREPMMLHITEPSLGVPRSGIKDHASAFLWIVREWNSTTNKGLSASGAATFKNSRHPPLVKFIHLKTEIGALLRPNDAPGRARVKCLVRCRPCLVASSFLS